MYLDIGASTGRLEREEGARYSFVSFLKNEL
jgi:hypothetical protein